MNGSATTLVSPGAGFNRKNIQRYAVIVVENIHGKL